MRIFLACTLALGLGGCLAAPWTTPVDKAAALAPLTPPSAAKVRSTAATSAPVSALDVDFSEPAAGELPAVAPVFVDAETAEDNRLLAGSDQTPPEDEGETLVPDAPRFDFPVVENEKVRYYLDYYSGPARGAFGRWLERSGRYLPMMRQIFAEEGLPLDLAYLAMIESGFNDRAHSWANAVGPWQFIESTGAMYGLTNDWWRDERRDPVKATRAAARHLKDLHAMFDGDWYLAVAAYNAGPGKIQRAMRQHKSRDFWEISRGTALQKETKNYLPKLLAALLITRDPDAYGFTDLELHPPLDYIVAEVPSATDLTIIAELCGVSYEEIKELNPELKRWCTPPGLSDYPVLLPVGTAERFAQGYAAIPVAKRANYRHHRVQKGDTLLALAKRHQIRVEDIVALNQIENPRALRIGTDLILPLHADYNSLPVEELADDYQRSRRPNYTVRKGDSLWTIARKFKVTEKELRVWNRLGWDNLIRPGQTLVVSGGSVQTAKKTGAQPVQKIVYQVRSGDTLWGIGRQFAVATDQIIDWNQLSEDHVLQPGDQLTLLVTDGRRG